MPSGFDSVKDLASSVASQGRPEDMHVGQVICLGMDELKEKLGEARWVKTQELLRKIMEETLVNAGSKFPRSAGAKFPTFRFRGSAEHVVGASVLGWTAAPFLGRRWCDGGV